MNRMIPVFINKNIRKCNKINLNENIKKTKSLNADFIQFIYINHTYQLSIILKLLRMIKL